MRRETHAVRESLHRSARRPTPSSTPSSPKSGLEPAHVFGEHKFGTSLVNGRGCRLANQVQEEEAAEIGGELLIPFEAAKTLARRNATNEEVALQFGVSTDMARWRMDATGARKIAARQAAAYTRARGA